MSDKTFSPDSITDERQRILWFDLSRLYADYCGDDPALYPQREAEFLHVLGLVDEAFIIPTRRPIAPVDSQKHPQWIVDAGNKIAFYSRVARAERFMDIISKTLYEAAETNATQ